MKFNTVEEALDELRAGKIILVTDDEDRENEGDFICAAEFATTENIKCFFYCVEFHILCPFSYDFEAVQLHNFLTIQPHAHSQTRTIPHTVSQTVLKDRKVGAVVNLETDIIGKYVEKLLCKGQPEGITRDFLAKYGF